MVNREPTRNLGLELVRVTEAAALAAARQMGRGDKNTSDKAAVDAMRFVLNAIEISGVIVIGEGEKDEAPMLYNGEKVGTGNGPQVDIAVDPHRWHPPAFHWQPKRHLHRSHFTARHHVQPRPLCLHE